MFLKRKCYILTAVWFVYAVLWHAIRSDRGYRPANIPQQDNRKSPNYSDDKHTTSVTTTANHSGYYMNLSSYDPNNRQFQVVRDICIESVPGTSNKTRLVVYDDTITAEVKTTISAEAYFGSKFHIPWHILKRKGPIPKHFVRLNQTLFLYFEKFPNNIFHFIHDSFRGLFGLMQRLGRLNAPGGNHILRWSCPSVGQVRFREFIDRLGPNIHFGDCKDYAVVKDVCFPHGVAGFIPPQMDIFAQAQYKSFGIGQSACERNLIVFMKRSSRRIGNIYELAAGVQSLLHKSGFSNTSVRVADFEEFSVREQFIKISCTRLLIGVQGAGIHWHVFQPKVGGVLELGWHNWPPGMYAGLARRRGLMAHTFRTDQYYVDWGQYSRANGKDAKTMTDAAKNASFILKKPVWKDSNPSKFGVGQFDVQTFVEKVLVFLKAFRDKGIPL